MKKSAYQLYCYLAILIAYLFLTFFTLPSPIVLHHYQLSVASYRFVLMTVAVPLMFIWLVAFYGFAKLQHYADIIKRNKDGRAAAAIARGLMYLVFQLPVISTIDLLLSYLDKGHHWLLPTVTLTEHYIRLGLPLVAFLYISYGARQLIGLVKLRPTDRAIHLLAILFIILGGGFTYFVFYGPATGLGAFHATTQELYYLPRWLIFFTIVVPYVYMWYIGALAAFEIYLFQVKVPGILYRQGWNLLAAGLGWTILVSIVYQYLTSLSGHLSQLHVNVLLLLVYALLVFLAVGYVLIALGAKKMQKIEEV